VEQYGAFVNIGSETDGLVHVSQLSVRLLFVG
jgi:predicted RNA-binding protein with RPS1 domain